MQHTSYNVQAAPQRLEPFKGMSRDDMIRIEKYNTFIHEHPELDKFFKTKCDEYSKHFGYKISPELAYAHIYRESKFKLDALGSRANGDYGLMQITDNLAKQLNKEFAPHKPTKADPHPQKTRDTIWDHEHNKKNIYDNIEMGIANIGENLRNNRGNILKSIENYNGGERRIQENKDKLAADFNELKKLQILKNKTKNKKAIFGLNSNIAKLNNTINAKNTYLKGIQEYKAEVFQVYNLYSTAPRSQS